MNLKKSILTVLFLMAVVATMAMPRNSYLLRPANSKSALMSQVRNEPMLMDRYMRHFSMSEAEVIEYIGSLRLSRIERTGIYGVFGVPENGKIHSTMQNLRKGALIWIDTEGNPVLYAVCGNPMTLGPKRATMSEVLTTVPATVPSEIVAIATTPSAPVVPSPVVASAMPPTPVASVVDIEPEGVVLGSRSGGFFLPALLGASALLASNDGGKEPVPEPATMTALALGAASLIARKRKSA